MTNTEAPFYFPGVTLLITHYNRSGSLERLLSACRERGCSFDDIVVSDDGSKPEHLGALKRLQGQYGFQLVTTPVNRGLGNNINKGQDAVKTPYTLYVQEDFVPTPAFPGHFRDALEIMKAEDKWDLITLYGYSAYPYMKPYKKGFSEKIFKPWHTNHLKFYYYGDHPHLRRSDFLKKFGRYVEGKNVDVTELTMSLSFIKNQGRGLMFDQYKALFDQVNTSQEPSTATYRQNWRERKHAAVLFMRWLYLKYKFLNLNYRLLLTNKIEHTV
ncbi:glycosyltransferase [Rufibacter tibetensis]|uniref:Glycosyl transferase family 2 n=1 Tax=Rufibacter tibetensis TaxID=512763 RepID=A0A0P0CK37_9BACT|nr:glycosyltransferase [Rufibacter tibetensis]ALI99887.1 glycosyl transferase family 2 [Rufibacter tibetensis]